MDTKLATMNIVDVVGLIEFHMSPRWNIPLSSSANHPPIADRSERELKELAIKLCNLYLEQQFSVYNPSLKITEEKDKDTSKKKP